MKSLKLFLISAFVLAGCRYADACLGTMPERWYMMCYYDGDFQGLDDPEIEGFWKKYCRKGDDDYITDDTRMEAALKKGDRAMISYLNQLVIYDKACGKITDPWSYPTKEELRQQRSLLQGVVEECKQHTKGKYADRWLLLQMRANMVLGDYRANIALWDGRGSKLPDSAYKRMMRNIYANALLNTGERAAAWDIYADQQDVQSLVWSVRKYTNLAGIMKVYEEDPNAKVLGYLLQHYVNNMQDFFDCYDDLTEEERAEHREKLDPEWLDTYGEAYAHIDEHFMREARDFVRFADEVAHGGKTDEPGLWMTASALVSYFLGDYRAAKTSIDEAMDMEAPQAVKKATRRIRMLIEPKVADVKSAAFKEFMASELAWLEQDYQTTDSYRIGNAYHRILNQALTPALLQSGQEDLAILTQAVLNKYENRALDPNDEDVWSRYYAIRALDDHSSRSFNMLFDKSGDEIVEYFAFAGNPQGDALASHFAQLMKYDQDYVNDVVGTKYLQEGNFAKAEEYLKRVSQKYLERQLISYYVARRDYHKPAWDGYQSLGNYYADPEITSKVKGNVKLDFCREMQRLLSEYETATPMRRQEIAYEMATYYYQASRCGQCWFITNYSASSPLCYADITGDLYNQRSLQLLKEAAGSDDQSLRAKALFGIFAHANDYSSSKKYWAYIDDASTDESDAAVQNAFDALMGQLAHCAGVPAEISRCDVLRRFRK